MRRVERPQTLYLHTSKRALSDRCTNLHQTHWIHTLFNGTSHSMESLSIKSYFSKEKIIVKHIRYCIYNVNIGTSFKTFCLKKKKVNVTESLDMKRNYLDRSCIICRVQRFALAVHSCNWATSVNSLLQWVLGEFFLFEFAIGFVLQPELPLVVPLPTSLHSTQPAGVLARPGLLSTAQARKQYPLNNFSSLSHCC